MRIEDVQLENGRVLKLASLTFAQVEAMANSSDGTVSIFDAIADSLNNAIAPFERGVRKVPDGVTLYTAEELKQDFDIVTAKELFEHINGMSRLKTPGEEQAETQKTMADQSTSTLDTSAAA